MKEGELGIEKGGDRRGVRRRSTRWHYPAVGPRILSLRRGPWKMQPERKVGGGVHVPWRVLVDDPQNWGDRFLT